MSVKAGGGMASARQKAQNIRLLSSVETQSDTLILNSISLFLAAVQSLSVNLSQWNATTAIACSTAGTRLKSAATAG